MLGYVSLGFVKAKSCLEKMYIFGGGNFFTVWDVYVVMGCLVMGRLVMVLLVMGCFVCKSFFLLEP